MSIGVEMSSATPGTLSTSAVELRRSSEALQGCSRLVEMTFNHRCYHVQLRLPHSYMREAGDDVDFMSYVMVLSKCTMPDKMADCRSRDCHVT